MAIVPATPAADSRPRGRLPFAVALCLGLLTGCGPSLEQLRQANLPTRTSVPGVPALAQREDHCGPTSLAMLLSWSGVETSPAALAPRVFTPERRGTFALDLEREVRQQGRLAYRVRPTPEALLAEVAAGHPALVLENRGLSVRPLWHFSVLVGYDLERGSVVLHDGAVQPREKSLTNLLRTWQRGGAFGLTALPPGRLPAANDPEGILGAIANLEEVGSVPTAAAAYGTFLERWPGEWRGWFGRGNALHALGSDDQAMEALRRAHALAPERPEPLNNLALLAWSRGSGAEARALAEEALEAARSLGMDPSPYRDTLTEVAAPTL